jgi:hypothetical protein
MAVIHVLRGFFIAVAAVLAVASAAAAAPPPASGAEAVRKAAELVATQREEMNDACGRLRPFVLSGVANEASPIQAILAAGILVDGTANGVTLVGELTGAMTSAEDEAIAEAAFRRAARRTMETVNDQLDFVTASLHKIATPAALEEAVTVRDAMVAIRDAVKPFAAVK